MFAALSAFSLPVLLDAQGDYQFTPNFVDADIRQVVSSVAQATKSDIVIRDDVQGAVTFQSNAPMTRDELRRAMLARLRELGYEVDDRDGVLQIGPREP